MDFNLSRLNDIPDVIPAGDAAAKVPPPPPLTEATESPVRAVTRRRRALAVLGAVAWLAAQAVALGLRTDLERLGTAYALTQIAVPAVAGAAALAVAVWPGRDGLGARAGTLRAVIVAALGAIAAVALLVPLPFPYAPPAGS